MLESKDMNNILIADVLKCIKVLCDYYMDHVCYIL